MHTIANLLTLRFLVAAIVIIVIPGPSVMFTVGRALAYGARVSVLTVIGNTTGALVIGAGVVGGLGVLLQGRPVLLHGIQILGSSYLIYLGIQAWRHRRVHLEVDDDEPSINTMKVLREGFVVGITNPKTIIFFTAVIPQFVRPDAGPVTLQLLIFILVFEAIALMSDSAWGVLAATVLRNWVQSAQRLAIVVAIGSLMIVGLGLWLLGSAISAMVA